MRVKSDMDSRRGQSLAELALLLPILITLLLGMVEVVNIGHTYLALLDTSYQGAHLGSQGIKLYDNTKIYTLVTQDLTNKGYNTSNLIDVIIIRADLTGGTGITNYNAVSMKSPGRATVLTVGALQGRLQSSDPAGKLIAVEIVYDYRLIFPWPKIKGLLPDPFPLRAYTIQYSPR
jgi:Flp pilus assembly protein TadG